MPEKSFKGARLENPSTFTTRLAIPGLSYRRPLNLKRRFRALTSMSKKIRIVVGIVAAYLVISFLHVWLNIGFSNFLSNGPTDSNSFRVGFLPVT